MIDRRRFLLTSVAGALGMPLVADAQQAGKRPTIGVLFFTSSTRAAEDGFRQGLRDDGYDDGRNIVVEWRAAGGNAERATAMAAELVKQKVDVIVAVFTPAVLAAKNASREIPIVMAPAGDPVGTGLVASVAHPGGNVTGLTDIAVELAPKRLELARDVVPGLTRVGLLLHGADPLDRAFVDETQKAAARFGITLQVIAVPRAQELEPALSALGQSRAGAVIIQANVPVPARQTADAFLRHRLPSISNVRQFAEVGGLLSYGTSLADIQRRAAGYVVKILKGAKPADLPVETPTKLELLVNLKTAKALNLTIPPSLLARADQVIE